MNRAIILFTGLCSAFSFLPQALADLNDGLVAYWSFDNCDATDDSGNGRHGTIMGTPQCVDGASGKALRFQGQGTFGDAGDHVLIPMIDFGSMNRLSICLWANEEGMSTNADGEAYIYFGDATNGSMGIGHYGVYVPPGDVRFHVGTPNVIQTLKVAFNPSDLNRFTFYCLIYKNGEINAYRNGDFLGKQAQTIQVWGNNAAIARHWWYGGSSTSTRYIGTIDDVRIYDRALTDAEINALWSLSPALPGVGGSVTGMFPETVDCLNETTGQDVEIVLEDGATAWNCEEEGLMVDPGDRIIMTVNGDVPREGDLNGDGCIDLADANILLDYVRGGGSYNEDLDLNEDGAVDVADARTLVLLFDNPLGAPCD